MVRLPCLVVMFAATVFVGQSAAQDSQPFAIAGDVRMSGRYFFASTQQVDLADLLTQAGLSAEAGNAVVFRGQPLSVVSTSNVRRDALHRQTPLTAGDVVVFRRFEGGPVGDGTAVIADGGIPVVVSLPGGSLPLSEVLTSLDIRVGGPVSVIHTEWGRQVEESLDADDLVQHGDVLDLTAIAREQPLRAAATLAEVPQVTLFGEENTLQIPDAMSATENATSAPTVLPTPDSSDLSAPSKTTLAPERLSTQANPAQTTAALTIPRQQQAPSLFVPSDQYEVDNNAPIAGATSDATANDGEFVSSGQMDLSVAEANTLPEKTETQASTEVSHSDDSSDTNNSLFRTASLQRFPADRTSPSTQTPQTATSGEASTPSNAAMNGIFVIGLMMAVVLIVAGWIRTQQEQAMADSNSSDSDFADDEQTVTARQAVGLDAAVDNQLTHHELNAGEIAEILATTEPLVRSESHRTVRETSRTVEAEADQHAANGDALEDLIQNRLPLELKQTQLPLQIALFGRPAGPRRLRIDAAHTQIAAPKMDTVARRSRQQKHATVVESANNPSAGQSSTSAERSTAADVSRFDRALNFLEEQSEK
ncbi:MAG: hypothetical protein R3C59_05875 [Planctomycetaceae bacterium]